MTNRFKFWLDRNEVSYERAAYGLEWDVGRVKELAEYHDFPSKTEMHQIEVYTFGDVRFRDWRRFEYDLELKKRQRLWKNETT